MLVERLKAAVDSFWAKHKTFRFLTIVTFFMFTATMAFLTLYIFRYYKFLTFILLLALLGVAHKKDMASEDGLPSENSSY